MGTKSGRENTTGIDLRNKVSGCGQHSSGSGYETRSCEHGYAPPISVQAATAMTGLSWPSSTELATLQATNTHHTQYETSMKTSGRQGRPSLPN
jgi:hypothetical protein